MLRNLHRLTLTLPNSTRRPGAEASCRSRSPPRVWPARFFRMVPRRVKSAAGASNAGGALRSGGYHARASTSGWLTSRPSLAVARGRGSSATDLRSIAADVLLAIASPRFSRLSSGALTSNAATFLSLWCAAVIASPWQPGRLFPAPSAFTRVFRAC